MWGVMREIEADSLYVIQGVTANFEKILLFKGVEKDCLVTASKVSCRKLYISRTPCFIISLDKCGELFERMDVCLEVLSIYCARFTTDALCWLWVHLKKFQNLHSLVVRGIGHDFENRSSELNLKLIDLLSDLPRLRSLEISGWRFYSQPLCLAFGDYIKGSTVLRELTLKYNSPKKYNYDLRDAIGENQSLTLLILDWSLYERPDDLVSRLPITQANISIQEFYLFDSHERYVPEDVHDFVLRNRKIRTVIRSIVLLLIWAGKTRKDCGLFGLLGKDVVKLIAKEVWKTRNGPVWLNLIQ